MELIIGLSKSSNSFSLEFSDICIAFFNFNKFRSSVFSLLIEITKSKYSLIIFGSFSKFLSIIKYKARGEYVSSFAVITSFKIFKESSLLFLLNKTFPSTKF